MEVLHKLCDVLRSLVANNLFRHSKLFPHVVVKVLGHLWCSNGVSCWDENNHFQNESTTTNIALYPADSGKPVMRSDETCVQGLVGVRLGCVMILGKYISKL